MRIRNLGWIVVLVLAALTPSAAQQMGITPNTAQTARVGTRYGQVPLTFEANRGQSAGQVKFLSRGKGYTAFLTASGMTITLRPSGSNRRPSAAAVQPSATTTLQFQVLGASKHPAVIGEDPQPGRVNYFIGNDPTKWQRNVPTYAKVRYKNVYPGIDLVYYGNHQQLEYDFAVAPGADPRQIQFQIGGANQIQVDAAGNLVLKTSGGELHFESPIVYQESNGQRVPVNGGYIVKDSTHIGFQVAHYDAGHALVIDPVLVYSTYLGGSGDDQPSGIAVDASGNVLVAGTTDSADFPLAATNSLAAGNPHVFVAKLDPTGSNLIYADYLGGNNQDYAAALTVDADDNVYVTGSTASSNFPTVTPYQGTYPGTFNGFLSKISPDGSSLSYSTYFGGNGADFPASLAVDAAGEMVIAGYTTSTNLPVANAYQSTASANGGGQYGNYGFLTKFSADGSALVYSTYFGGSTNVAFNCGGTACWPQPDSAIAGMVLDASGNAYVTGTTNTYNFPVTEGAYLATNTAPQYSSVGFVSKFTGSGTLQYSTYFYEGSGQVTNPTAIAVDGSGSAYITGLALSDGTFPVTSTSICDPGVSGEGCNYAFVTKFDTTGATLLYSTFLGANNNAAPQSIALDAAGDAYVLASTTTGSMQTNNALQPYTNGNDLLLVEINPTATTQLLASYLGGSGNDSPNGMALDSDGNVYVTGTTDSTDFPTTQGAFQSVLGGGTDAFIMKIGAPSAPAVALTPNILQFAALAVNSTSQPQTVLLRNIGSSSLSIESITAGGDFAETDNCGSSVPAAGNCTLSVTFAPTAPGSRTGSIVILDDASGASHSITLEGFGNGAGATLTPSNLTFSGVSTGSSSTAQAVTLTNTGNASLSVGTIQVSGNYAQTNNCPTTLTTGSSCNINVIFSPVSSGTQTGVLTISDNAMSGSQTVSLTGSTPDFTLTAAMSAATLNASGTATYALTVSPIGGSLSNAVSLSCSGLPANTTCSFSQSAVIPGAKSTPVTLTIATATASAEAVPALPPSPHRPVGAVWIQFQGLGLFGMVVAGCSKRSKRLTIVMLIVLMVLGMMFMTGCAGGTGIAPAGQSANTAKSYTITVTGTSGTLQHSLPLTLTVE